MISFCDVNLGHWVDRDSAGVGAMRHTLGGEKKKAQAQQRSENSPIQDGSDLLGEAEPGAGEESRFKGAVWCA